MDLELRRDPQRLLEQIEDEERRKKRGRLKIFLGYASGVGKSAKMLAEGLRRRERGEDVVVEAVQLEFLKNADDIEVVDAPAQAKLSRLREMALLVAAEVVEAELRGYLRAHHIEEIWGTQERILVGITPRSDARPILESGRRNADRFHGELFVAYVRQPNLSVEDEAKLEENLAIAREVNASIKVLEGRRDPASALIAFARDTGITQIFIGHSMRKGFWQRLRGNPVERLIDLAEGIDVRVFPQRTTA